MKSGGRGLFARGDPPLRMLIANRESSREKTRPDLRMEALVFALFSLSLSLREINEKPDAGANLRSRSRLHQRSCIIVDDAPSVVKMKKRSHPALILLAAGSCRSRRAVFVDEGDDTRWDGDSDDGCYGDADQKRKRKREGKSSSFGDSALRVSYTLINRCV